MLKCDCGYEYDRFRYGVNSSYHKSKTHQTALVRSGKYGKQWQKLLTSDPSLSVNAEMLLYQCKKCHKITNEYSLDLYKTEYNQHDYYNPTHDEVIYTYKHICPDCKGKMEQIPLTDKGGDDFRNEELPVICPKCGNTAKIKFCGYTD